MLTIGEGSDARSVLGRADPVGVDGARRTSVRAAVARTRGTRGHRENRPAQEPRSCQSRIGRVRGLDAQIVTGANAGGTVMRVVCAPVRTTSDRALEAFDMTLPGTRPLARPAPC